MASKEFDYDVILIGSGIAGSTMALCLAQSGVKVLVVEHRKHPRFVIGESTIVITTFNFNYLGQTYNIPELDGLSTYWVLRKSDKVTCFPKCHFWYGCHQEGKELERGHQLMAETFPPPQGPDAHFVRSDLDAYLVSLFPKYGVNYLDRTSISDFNNTADGVTMDLQTRTGDEEAEEGFNHNEALAEEGIPDLPKSSGTQRRTVRCKYVVDCSGHSAFLSRKFKMLQKEAQLATRTRTIYGHFNYEEGWNLDNYCNSPVRPDYRYSRHAGTQHHFFPGGWIWVIPFDNNTVSVGLVLDVDKYPYGKEEEFWHIINKYPTIKNHLSPLKQCMPFVRTGRIQLKSDTIQGERFILTPHASGFIDPLFSSGIALTTTFIVRFVPAFKQALADNEFSKERFEWIEKRFYHELNFVDKMVAGTIFSSTHPELYKQYMRVWFEAASRAHFDMFLYDANQWPIFGSHDQEFVDAVEKAFTLVRKNFHNTASDQVSVAREVKAILDPLAVGCTLAAYEFPILSEKPVNGMRLRHSSLMKGVLKRQPRQFLITIGVFFWFVFAYCLSSIGLYPYPYAKFWNRSYSFMPEDVRNKFNFLPRRPERTIESAHFPKTKWGLVKLTYYPEIAKQEAKKLL